MLVARSQGSSGALNKLYAKIFSGSAIVERCFGIYNNQPIATVDSYDIIHRREVSSQFIQKGSSSEEGVALGQRLSRTHATK